MRKAYAWIKDVLQMWPGIYAIPLVLAKFFLWGHVIRFFDPTAATFDTGILETSAVVMVAAVINNELAWLCIRLNLPRTFKRYKDRQFINKSAVWETEDTIVVAVFLGLFFSLCLLDVGFAGIRIPAPLVQ